MIKNDKYKKKIKLLESLHVSEDKKYIYNQIEPIFNADKDLNIDNRLLYLACELAKRISTDDEEKLINKRFPNRLERYEEFIKPNMILIDSDTFMMGTDKEQKMIYCGETPKHEVKLSSYYIGKTSITNRIYGKFNLYKHDKEMLNKPVTNISWYDAYVFSKWCGCRLISEAEWEYAARANSKGLWYCTDEKELMEYAWFSENSKGKVHDIATLRPNGFGLYDMHGNVWELCQDTYEEDYYSKSPKNNPLNNKIANKKVCRGGSIHAFSEMCRNSFRDYVTADFYAFDLGFRVAKDANKQ